MILRPNKPRYLKQRLATSCGPVAIINAIKWTGQPCTRKNKLADLLIVCKVCPVDGCEASDLDQAIYTTKEFDVVRRIVKPNLTDLDCQLDLGHSIILAYWHEQMGHAVFIPKKTDYYFTIVNREPKARSRKPTVSRISKKLLERFLSEVGTQGELSVAWIIKRPQDYRD